MKKPLQIANVIVLVLAVSYLVYKNTFRFQSNSDKGKASYTLGQDVAKNLLRQGIPVDEDIFYQGFLDGLSKSSEITEEEKKIGILWAQNQAKAKYNEQQNSREKLVQNEMAVLPKSAQPYPNQGMPNQPQNWVRPGQPHSGYPPAMAQQMGNNLNRPPYYDPRFPMGMKPASRQKYPQPNGPMVNGRPYDNRVKPNSVKSKPNKEAEANK